MIRTLISAGLTLAIITFYTPLTNAEEPAVIKARACKRCSSSGATDCKQCKGKGSRFGAQVKCPRCDGESTVLCKKCEEGKIKCKKCKKKRNDDGEYERMMIGREWKEWDREYGSDAPKKSGERPKAPTKYVTCTYCEGSGDRACTTCEGESKVKCTRCAGDGKISGVGPCEDCKALGLVACQVCCLPGEGESEELNVLQGLCDKKLISAADYFQRRRLLVAQLKHKAALSAAAAAKAGEEEAPASGQSTPTLAAATTTPLSDLKATRSAEANETHTILLQGVSSKLISPKNYLAKLRETGLSEDEILAKEEEAAANSVFMKNLVTLRKDFRAGKLNYNQYVTALEQLQ